MPRLPSKNTVSIFPVSSTKLHTLVLKQRNNGKIKCYYTFNNTCMWKKYTRLYHITTPFKYYSDTKRIVL